MKDVLVVKYEWRLAKNEGLIHFGIKKNEKNHLVKNRYLKNYDTTSLTVEMSLSTQIEPERTHL